MINNIITSLIVFSGLIFGAILALIAKEELKPGKRYFRIFQNILFAIIAAITIYFAYIVNIFLAMSVLGISLYVLFSGSRFADIMMYSKFAFIFYFTRNTEFFILLSSLIFLYGFPAGTLFADSLKEKSKIKTIAKTAVRYSIFLTITIVML